MKNLERAGILLALSFQILQAQPEIVAKFVTRQHPYSGGYLKYLLFVPEPYDSTRRYPLMLALHGSTDAYSFDTQMGMCRYATVWADPVNQTQHPCFVVAPSCPSAGDWSTVYEPVLGMLDSLERKYAIDTNRVYITGISMGGFGTWGMITHYPERFAAAVPMSAGGAPALVDEFANMPIWNYHGALDPAVSVESSRQMIRAMEQHGRYVVYTHCRGADIRCLPDSIVAMHVASHSDLLYTETASGLHDSAFFNWSYNYRYLAPWVFDKHRLIPAAVWLSNLSSYRTLNGITPLTWNGGTPSDSVELWFSPDAGRTWRLIERSVPNTGNYLWNTNSIGDCALALVNIFLKDRDGHIYSRDQSGLFAINNPGNGSPSVSFLRNLTLTSGTAYTPDTLSVVFRAADPEGDILHISVFYSKDHGGTFVKIDSFVVPSDSLPYARVLSLWSGANSSEAMLEVEASDGMTSGVDLTPAFIKQTPRGRQPEQSATEGGTVWVNVIDAAKLTNDLYRLVFTDSAGGKWYDVLNVTRGIKSASSASVPFDGITEGPLFDGIRLVVRDYAKAEADLTGSRWEIGSSKYFFSFSIPEVDMGSYVITGVPYGADYRIALHNTVVDTSSAAIFGAERIPMKFDVWNITENREAEVVYVDGDANRELSNLDEVYILESDSVGHPMLTWGLTFLEGSVGNPAPVPGDAFLFKTFKPIKNGDTYEFRGTVVSVTLAKPPASFRLEQNYPNPFNPVTTIKYTVGGAGIQGPGTGNTRLVVYDVLGRRVVTLVDEVKASGSYEVCFDASRLASGVYFYRLTAGSYVESRKMVLLK